jgi:YHS domain-containing protein
MQALRERKHLLDQRDSEFQRRAAAQKFEGAGGCSVEFTSSKKVMLPVCAGSNLNFARIPNVTALEAKDPICGMAVDVISTKSKSEFHGNPFYFCCAGCKQTFDKRPDKYALEVAG